MTPLPRSFYDRDAAAVAPELLGQLLVRRINGVARIGRIVEAEAYLGPHDLAAHTSKGRTRRNEVMFGPPGHAYIYLIYGMYHCLNAVTGPDGHGSAVLLRALEPVENIEGTTNGPGRLCRALAIDLQLKGSDLTDAAGEMGLFAGPALGPGEVVARSPRIGVDYAGEWAAEPLRFFIAGNRFVSRKS